MKSSPGGATERPIDLLNAICEEIFQRWDKDQRSGKLLSALGGRFTGYRPDVTLVRQALEAYDPSMLEACRKALEEIGDYPFVLECVRDIARKALAAGG